jgi:hypothetical protein
VSETLFSAHLENVKRSNDANTISPPAQPPKRNPAPRSNWRTTASMAGHGVQGVDEFKKLLQEMLERAEMVKESRTVDPPVTKSDLRELFERVEDEFFSSATTPELRKRKHAVIETAVRETFNSILVSLLQT